MTIRVTARRFVWLSVIFAMIVAVVLAEFSLGVMERYQRKTSLDFGDAKRLQEMGWGGYLKENFIGSRDRRLWRQGAMDQQCRGISQ